MPKHVAPSHVRLRRLARGGAVSLGAAAVGLGVMAAPASAETSHDWSGVAKCESGGNWSTNTGNGYKGGLQISQSTWAGHGGTAYAPSADQASPAQQIAVAEKVLTTQGRGAWPVCGRYLTGGSTRVSDSSTASRGHRTEPAQQPSTAKAAPQKRSTTTAAPRSNKATTKAAPKATTSKGSTSTATKRSSTTASAHHGRTYTVKPGDTLVKIARAQGLDSWRDLWAKNRSTVHDPNRIWVGQTLHVG